jgi:FkbM family methyltransferase
MLKFHDINTVFDVGANTGQFGRELRSQADYHGRIVSFEPLSDAYVRLVKAAAGYKRWDVAPRVAIGAGEGTVTINVAANSLSSSVLSMLDSHVQAAPESLYTGQETVQLTSLDKVAPLYLEDSSITFLKIDTQGYEGPVLAGATRTLTRLTGVQLELSLVPLYAGQRLMPDLMEFMRDSGFDLWAVAPVLADPTSGRLLQFDATFFRHRQ